MKIKILVLFALISLVFISCEDYVSDVDDLVDAVKDEVLDDPAQIAFLIKGVEQRFATASDQTFVLADGLSDQLTFYYGYNKATYSSFYYIEYGYIYSDNNSVDGALEDVGQLRYYADRLVTRIRTMAENYDVDTDDYNEAMYTGYLYGGFARYMYATYYGLSENEGGATIDTSAFIPSAAMYDSAVVKFTKALDFVSSDYDTRLINSLIARCYMYDEDYESAVTYAENGLVEGDDEFQSLYSSITNNYYYSQAGNGRLQWTVDYRFSDYITENSQEANRVKLDSATSYSVLFYYQGLYPDMDDPINVMTWQENSLMLAELAVRGNYTGGDAVSLVNAVRTSHDIDDLASVDLDVIAEERDKELFCTGARLPDERRFDQWHLSDSRWHYLPLTDGELNANPNL